MFFFAATAAAYNLCHNLRHPFGKDERELDGCVKVVEAVEALKGEGVVQGWPSPLGKHWTKPETLSVVVVARNDARPVPAVPGAELHHKRHASRIQKEIDAVQVSETFVCSQSFVELQH